MGVASLFEGVITIKDNAIWSRHILEIGENATAALVMCISSLIIVAGGVVLAAARCLRKGRWWRGAIMVLLALAICYVAILLFAIGTITITGRS